ncbi:predicted protein [Chaetomium globosum CBS 148.51]|uniref:BZIP domain-containing protein n=1 Tax=Chaetomium globosum (strain ATCC 6205 / CBS 148.51 / DSM 1962 / NBRC 6347 / NRRL 1970) TaxID=306901 RepID=Q2GW36_CHAGB|nr:uncharacterized protein CHGG_07818 [Chaetomium globosum CBS 148.51]EAQ86565.1 predicted protein [Chaetomium globosum CBS 148.51]
MEADYWAFFGLVPPSNHATDTDTPRDGTERSCYGPTPMPELQRQQSVGENTNGPICTSSTRTGRPGPTKAGAKRRRVRDKVQNRLAVAKSREKKKWELEQKQNHLEDLEKTNSRLKADLISLTDEMYQLRQDLMAHGGCGDADIDTCIKSQGGSNKTPRSESSA